MTAWVQAEPAPPPSKEAFEAEVRKGLDLEHCAPKHLEPIKYVERDVNEGRFMLIVMSERSERENEGFALGPFDGLPTEAQRVSLLGRQLCNDK